MAVREDLLSSFQEKELISGRLSELEMAESGSHLPFQRNYVEPGTGA